MQSAHDKIAAGLEDAVTLATVDPAVADAMGEVVASMMKRDTLDDYRAERDAPASCAIIDTGTYEGCLAEAQEMVRRLRARGFDVVKIGG